MPPNKNFVFLSLVATFIIQIDSLQIPFLSNPQPSSSLPPAPSSSVFQLQQAVHITKYKNRRLHLRRIFNQTDRETIDIRSNTLHSAATTTDGSPIEHYYPSSHSLKVRTGKVWSHRATLNQWKLAHQRQILLDQSLRNFEDHSEILANNITLMNSQLNWSEFDTVLPDVTDIETLASLAMMTNNAYTLPGDDRWYDPGGAWNLSDSFGWEEDGLRGHVFATPDNSTIVIAIKGTSAGLLGNGGSTGVNDKLNDNLFFSCCCARVSWSWSPVCDCYEGPNKCRASCVEGALMNKSVYFQAAVDLYDDIVRMYPHSQIWLAGHSLGAALAGILGVTFGIPAVGFEAPGDLLPAQRLHLPLPPGANFGKGQEMSHVFQVFHTADPIAMGTCNGALSSCSVAGYALETRCHLGQSIIFDTVGKLKWAQDIRTHPIQTVIDKVLRPDWIPGSTSSDCQENDKQLEEEGFRWPWSGRKNKGSDCPNENDEPIVPIAQPQDCEEGDCPLWEFRDSWDDNGGDH
ncbi:putative lipase atg15 [Puccinia graminis f. sp. tritici]|uniref:triacylglycerol lipase n=1 Tax=Puccinia graminis f. sp. tritici TaxID=56615 RepID=A0A5B0P5M1_PUCGR|nr:putative lipase atg15 [Puccinia graminis f. sp. tritici]